MRPRVRGVFCCIPTADAVGWILPPRSGVDGDDFHLSQARGDMGNQLFVGQGCPTHTCRNRAVPFVYFASGRAAKKQAPRLRSMIRVANHAAPLGRTTSKGG